MFRGTHQYLVDDKGRVAIPARFREVLSGLQDERLVVTKFRRRGEYAGIGREVMFVGATDKFRVWAKDVYHQVDRDDEKELFEDNPDLLDELGL